MASEWKTVRLGDLTTWASGGTPPKANPIFWNGDIPWISASSMKTPLLCNSDLKITKEGLENGSRLAETNSILLLVRGSELHKRIPIGIATRPVAFNQDVKALNVCGDMRSDYLFYWLLGNETMLLGKVEHTGIGAGKLDTQVLKNLPLALPPLAEQKAIAAVLGALDDKIELNRRMNATLEGMARALFQSWFVDFDPVRAKLDGRKPEGMDKATAALFPDAFQESSLGPVPSGWKVKALGEVIELAYGKPLKAEDRKGGPVCVYGANGPVGWHDEKLVTGPGIVVGRKGNPGVVTWAHSDFYPIDTTFYVEPRGEYHSLNFLYYALSLHNLANLSADSAVPGLNRNHAYMSKQILPSQPVLIVFDSQITPVFSAIHTNEEESRTLANLRDTLLPKLLSGELSVASSKVKA